MEVLGIPIDVISRKGILERAERYLEGNVFHQIVTVNPEFALLAETNASFRSAVLAADLRIADGAGIALAGLVQGRLIERFPGVDLMEKILKICEEKNIAVFLAIRKDGLSSLSEIEKVLAKKYPLLKVFGQEYDADSSDVPPALSGSGVVFCNFGAPMQELFLSRLRNTENGVSIAMGVGGSFDYMTGKTPRAPKIMRGIGLEWLWRLFLQPARIGRIFNAVVIFPLHLIFSTMEKK